MPEEHRISRLNHLLPHGLGSKTVIFAFVGFYAVAQFIHSDSLNPFMNTTKIDLNRISSSSAVKSLNDSSGRSNTRNRKTTLEGATSAKGERQIQKSHHTEMNRYPDEYTYVTQYLKDHLSAKPNKKILSFGAATGLEAITLATMYLTGDTHFNTQIYGVDLSQPSLDKGAENVANHVPSIQYNKIIFFNGKDTDIGKYGKYDAIFANSVFCLHGDDKYENDSSARKEVTEVFSFEDFEASLRYLDASLNDGGVLAIVNMSYELSESTLAKRYKPVAQCGGNFVRRYNQENDAWIKPSRSTSKMDCVWVKQSSFLRGS